MRATRIGPRWHLDTAKPTRRLRFKFGHNAAGVVGVWVGCLGVEEVHGEKACVRPDVDQLGVRDPENSPVEALEPDLVFGLIRIVVRVQQQFPWERHKEQR